MTTTGSDVNIRQIRMKVTHETISFTDSPSKHQITCQKATVWKFTNYTISSESLLMRNFNNFWSLIINFISTSSTSCL